LAFRREYLKARADKMDHKLVFFVKGKLSVIRCAIEDIIGVYDSVPSFDKNLKDAVYALNRAESALDNTNERATPSTGGADAPHAVQRGSHEIDLSDDHADRASAAASNKSQPETVTPPRICPLGGKCNKNDLVECSECVY
jgi:hypothetical protein